MPADKATTPVSTRSISLRPAPCMALSFAGNSGAGALVKLIFATRFGFFAWYASIAPWVNARSPATSTTLIVTALFGNAGGCAIAPQQATAKTSAIAHCSVALAVSCLTRLLEEFGLLWDGCVISFFALRPADPRS